MKMLGLITPDGLRSWAESNSRHVEDYSRGLITAAAGAALTATDLNLFSYAKNENIAELVATGGTAVTYAADDIDTNLATKNRSPNADCLYTCFGLKILESALVTAAGSADDVLTLVHALMLTSRGFVQVFLGSNTEAFDQCEVTQCPPGYGLLDTPLSTAGLALEGPQNTGPLDMDGLRPLPMPFPVKEGTHIGIRISGKQHGGLYVSAAISIMARGFFRGVAAVGR